MNNSKLCTKKELALRYFPDSDPRTAVHHLMSWVNRCTELRQQLEVCHYRKTCKTLTPLQVDLIIYFLGDP